MKFDQVVNKLEFEKVRQRVMRYASSEPGRELLQSLPYLTDVEEVGRELSRVSELKQLLEQEEGFSLEGIHPVRGALQRAGVEGTSLLPRELRQIASTLRSARVVRSYLARRKSLFPLIWQVAETLHTDKVLEYNIDQAIDESGSLRATASKELQSIRRAIAERYELLKKRLESILKGVSELGFSQDDIITTREGRMVIPVKAEHKNRVPGFIHSASSSGATVFIEPTETLELNNDIRSLQFQEQREIDRILRILTEQVSKVGEPLLANLATLSRLDAIHARAKYSVEILGVQPHITVDGHIKLTQARHPILMMTHGFKETVPLDFELGDTFHTMIISGPNAGGKSVAMKCVGLLVLMVQHGLHIPSSDESVIRLFDNIFVDIGDEQSIENDLSTFSSHLSNLKAIEENADQNSLVLIDEIGTGTDPAEGGAIAAALLASLTKRSSFTIATTHHTALKVFASETEGVENGAMEFDQETLTPTYRFKAGIPGSSYALEMAARLGFSEGLLQQSREMLGLQHARLDKLIAELESSTQRYRKDIDLLLTEKTKLDSLVTEYESKLSAQSRELKATKQRALEEAKEIVEKANALIEKSIKDIRETGADREAIRKVREEVVQFREDIDAKRAEVTTTQMTPVERLAIGSPVQVVGAVETGEILNISSDGKRAVVLFGNVKMQVMTGDLRPSTDRMQLPRHASGLMGEKPKIPRDLDLRGLTGEEALPMVDKFIDDATLAGLNRVDIIHGKGTGALRKRIADFLSHHPRVKSFRLGEWNEGGTGATVVELTEQ